MVSDEEIVLQYKKSLDNNKLGPLLKKYKDKLFGIAYYYLNDRDLALDTVMETYEAILKSIHQKEITYFKGWAMSICRNLAMKKLRDFKKFNELTEISDFFMESNDDSVYKDENIDKLLDLIPQLKDNQRVCIDAFYFKNMTYAQIAENTEMTIKEVKSNLQNGKRNLKILFDKNP